MKGAPAPVLHWPKLFEGQVGLHTNKCVSGMGTGRDCWPDGMGDGYGKGYGNGKGYGLVNGNGYGSGWGSNE